MVDECTGSGDRRTERRGAMTSTATAPFDPLLLRQSFGCWPSGVTAVCAVVDGKPVGMAASSFTSVSLDPPLVSVCVMNGSSTWARLKMVQRLGVTILGEHHEPACRSLASRADDRFADIGWTAFDDGAVVIDGGVGWLTCELHGEVPAGDHHIALLAVHALATDPEVAPLVFHTSRYRRLAP
jgi:flavin reductase (DIM6/NTAB) family NADH-FMN oxidoreductase RutF